MHRHSKASSEFKVSLGFQMRQWEATGSQRLAYGSFCSRMPIMPVGPVCGSKRRVEVGSKLSLGTPSRMWEMSSLTQWVCWVVHSRCGLASN